MTHEEAKQVLDVMSGADDGCQYCVRDLFRDFLIAFPEHEQAVREAAHRYLGSEHVAVVFAPDESNTP